MSAGSCECKALLTHAASPPARHRDFAEACRLRAHGPPRPRPSNRTLSHRGSGAKRDDSHADEAQAMLAERPVPLDSAETAAAVGCEMRDCP